MVGSMADVIVVWRVTYFVNRADEDNSLAM